MISKCIQTPLFTSCNNLACCYYLVKLCVCLCVSGDTWASIFMSVCGCDDTKTLKDAVR